MASRQELRGYAYRNIAVSVNSVGENQIQAGVAGKHIVVIGYFLTRAGIVNAKFTSDDPVVTTSAPDITGNLLSLVSTAAQDRDPEYGLFWTQKGHDLSLNLSAGVEVSGYVLVVEAPEMPPTPVA